jgi:taurine transport system permease protein
VVFVLVVWWGLTHPFFEEEFIRRVESGQGVFVEETDPITGEKVRVRKPHVEEFRETRRTGLVNPPALDTPGNTFRDAWKLITDPGADHPTLQSHVAHSTFRILLGFLLSAFLAVPLGVAMGLFPRLRALVSPMISFLRPLPSISWVPLALIWLGAGELQKLVIIFMGSFSAALIYTVEATLKVNPDIVRAAQNLGVGQRQLLSKVLLPAALPNILSGLKVVMAIGWTCVISAEIVGTREGLGALIWEAKELSKTSWVFVGMVSISTLVLVFDAAFAAIERKLLPWVFR